MFARRHGPPAIVFIELHGAPHPSTTTSSKTLARLRDEFTPDHLGLNLDRVLDLDDVSDGTAFDPQDHRIIWRLTLTLQELIVEGNRAVALVSGHGIGRPSVWGMISVSRRSRSFCWNLHFES